MLKTVRIDSDRTVGGVRHVVGGNGESALEVVASTLPSGEVLLTLLRPFQGATILKAEGHLHSGYIADKFGLDPEQWDFASVVGIIRFALGRTEGNVEGGIVIGTRLLV